MSWQEKLKEFGSAAVMFLSADGASVNFIVAGDPVEMESKFKGKATPRVCAPVVCEDGLVIYVMGRRTFRKVASLEDKFKDHVINVTRHGEEGDSDATYEVRAIADATMFKRLQKIAAKTVTPDTIKDAFKDAQEVLSR